MSGFFFSIHYSELLCEVSSFVSSAFSGNRFVEYLLNLLLSLSFDVDFSEKIKRFLGKLIQRRYIWFVSGSR